MLFSLKTFIHLFILRPIVKLMFGINVYGRENISGLNRYILIANHNSHLDILLLFYLLPVKHIAITHPVAAEEYFSQSKIFFRLVNYLFNPIWVIRGDAEKRRKTLSRMKDLLNKGHNILLFPEGTRGEPGKLLPFKTGIGRLAEEYHNVPVVPVFLFGPERAMPKSYFLPVPIWMNIIIAPPQVFKESDIQTTHILEKTIGELSQTETVLYHKGRVKKRKKAMSVAFLGIDGSGKSTISKNTAMRLSESSHVALVSDTLKFFRENQPRQLQPLVTDKVREAVGRIAKSAGSLKLYKIPKLTELLLRDRLLVEVDRWYNPDTVVLDGCPLLNLTAWAILYKEEYFNKDICKKAIKILSSKDEEIPKNDRIYSDFPELKALKRFRLNHLKLPDIVIFLDVEPSDALRRIEKRGEKKQVHETREKLSKLREAYYITCEAIREEFNIPAHIVSGNDTIENITQSAVALVTHK